MSRAAWPSASAPCCGASSTLDDYEVLRLNEMPDVAVHIVRSGAKMGGIGEPATAPVSAAVANAVFGLTKRRLRSLPLRLA